MDITEHDSQTVAKVIQATQENMPAGAKLLVHDALLSLTSKDDAPSNLALHAWQYAQRSDEEIEADLRSRVGDGSKDRDDTYSSRNRSIMIQSITVRNWRSFKGEHTVFCSTDKDKPITLIFGPNGAGKTSLLNAFTWCLFGTFTAGFRESQQLVNHEAGEENESTMVKVRLLFDEQPIEVTRHGDRETAIVTIDRKSKTESDLYKLFPPALKDMFFFPAETFSNADIIDSGDTSGSLGKNLLPVRDSIIKLLSGNHYEQCSKSLAEAQQQNKLRVSGASNTKAQKAQDAHNLAKAKHNDLYEESEGIAARIEQARMEAENAREDARKTSEEAIREFEAKKLRLESQKDQVEKIIDQTNNLASDIFAAAPSVMLNGLLHLGEQRLDQAEKLGLVPPLMDPRILEQSLTEKRCLICREDFGQDTASRFNDLIQRATSGNTSRIALDARANLVQYRKSSDAQLIGLRARAKQLSDSLEGSSDSDADVPTVTDEASLQDLVSFSQSTIDIAISWKDHFGKLLEEHLEGDSDAKDDRLLFEKWKNLENKHSRLKERGEALPQLLEQARLQMEDTRKAWNEAASLTDENKKKAAAIELLASATEFFRTVHHAMQNAVRKDVEHQINYFYQDMVDKPYKVRVDDMFQLRVVNRESDTPVGISQSESVLLLLSFIAAISRLAPLYEQLRSVQNAVRFEKLGNFDEVQKGGLPVVIDAPVSAFDSRYEETTIKAIPEIAHQALVFVSKKTAGQWSKIENMIGKSYLMRLEGSSQVNDWLEWRDTKHQYTVHDDTTPGRTSIAEI